MYGDLKEEIKSRLPVEDVVGQYIELKRAGRNMKGRSPWGVDKTPSFMVSPEKGIWHDFSANKGGDIFTFVMEVEGIEFKEALEKLAAQAGVDMSKYSGGDPMVAKKKVRSKEALALAAKYYQACLVKNREVCEYVFYKRNMNRKTVTEFKIGYAPANGHALIDVLKKRGFSIEELDAAGLLTQYKRDLFRDRMMVPFFDTSGAVIGFTARVIHDGEPKYLNTPETLLFNKSRFIFGLYQAKEAIRHSGFVVIVEGNMDVISSHQAGVCEAVATSGTAMTEHHLKALSRLTSDIRLAYDGDAAGVRATERAIMLAGDLGITLSVISDYHGAKDPDELIQKDPELWKKAVSNYVPAVDWLLAKYEENLNLRSAPDKRQYSDVALKLLGYVKDEVERAAYEEKVARKLDVDVEVLRAKGSRVFAAANAPKRRFYKPVKTEVERPSVLAKLENSLLALKIYGGVSGISVPVPEDETRLSELELVFEKEHGGGSGSSGLSGPADSLGPSDLDAGALEREAKDLLKRYEEELKKFKKEELTARLAELDEDDPEAEKILREIAEL